MPFLLVAAGIVGTLVVGVVTWVLQRRSEHERWIRETRRVAYSDFLSAGSRFLRDGTTFGWATRDHDEGETSADYVEEAKRLMLAARLALVESLGAVLLLAPKESAEAAAAFMEVVPRVLRLAHDGNYLRSTSDDPESAARSAMARAVTLFRRDLGVGAAAVADV